MSMFPPQHFTKSISGFSQAYTYAYLFLWIQNNNYILNAYKFMLINIYNTCFRPLLCVWGCHYQVICYYQFNGYHAIDCYYLVRQLQHWGNSYCRLTQQITFRIFHLELLISKTLKVHSVCVCVVCVCTWMRARGCVHVCVSVHVCLRVYMY